MILPGPHEKRYTESVGGEVTRSLGGELGIWIWTLEWQKILEGGEVRVCNVGGREKPGQILEVWKEWSRRRQHVAELSAWRWAGWGPGMPWEGDGRNPQRKDSTLSLSMVPQRAYWSWVHTRSPEEE